MASNEAITVRKPEQQARLSSLGNKRKLAHKSVSGRRRRVLIIAWSVGLVVEKKKLVYFLMEADSTYC